MTKTFHKSSYLGIGIILGTLIGVVTDNIGLWLPIGLAIGAGLAETMTKNKPSNKQDTD